MKYISGIPALNVLCSLDTPGDWHAPSVDWKTLDLYESEEMFFKNYGIEKNKTIPQNTQKYNVANHIRAILDMFQLDNFVYLKGMRNNFIETDKYDDEIFQKVYSMKVLPNWGKIDAFMEKEYMLKWISYKEYMEQRSKSQDVFSKEDTSWQIEHEKIICDFLKYLNSFSDEYVLKGGTALLTCYNLDRFSEDIDLDSNNKNKIKKFVDTYCSKNKYIYRIAKDTDTTKRFFIHYGNVIHPLKIEVSFRSIILNSDCTKINGIKVYSINKLMNLKLNAYNTRDTIRDLYDITFIAKHYWDSLTPEIKSNLNESLHYKGLEHFDYILYTSNDNLIDKDKITVDFLELINKFNLAPKDELELER